MAFSPSISSQPAALTLAEGPVSLSDNRLAAFIAHLAEHTGVGERSARLYVAHVQRFGAWLRDWYGEGLVEAAQHDLREYKGQLAERNKPASINAAVAALRRFYGWAIDCARVASNPAQHLTTVETQSLAPKGFSDAERLGSHARPRRPVEWPRQSWSCCYLPGCASRSWPPSPGIV